MGLEDKNALKMTVRKIPPPPKVAERRWAGGPDVKVWIEPKLAS